MTVELWYEDPSGKQTQHAFLQQCRDVSAWPVDHDHSRFFIVNIPSSPPCIFTHGKINDMVAAAQAAGIPNVQCTYDFPEFEFNASFAQERDDMGSYRWNILNNG
jgi:hypothetical protein